MSKLKYKTWKIYRKEGKKWVFVSQFKAKTSSGAMSYFRSKWVYNFPWEDGTYAVGTFDYADGKPRSFKANLYR